MNAGAPLIAPAITQVSPQTIAAGSAGLTMTVKGSHFENTSNVLWNGSILQTRYVDTATLVAPVSNIAVAAPGTAQLQVQNGTGVQSSAVPVDVVDPAAPVTKPLAMTSSNLSAGQVGVAYTDVLLASGGTPNYAWHVQAGNLPPGLILAPGTGVISGVPTASGTFAFTVDLSDSEAPAQNQTANLSLAIAAPPLSISSSTSLPAAQMGSSYSSVLQATGGAPGYTWSMLSGSLPAGMQLTSSGSITGSPTTAGSSSFTVQVADGGSPAQIRTAVLSIAVTVPPLRITSSTLPLGQAGTSYSASLQATGGVPGYAWSVATGSLPVGLQLSAAGVLSGTPTSAGTTNISVQVKDSESPAQTQTMGLMLTIAPSPLVVVPPVLPSGQSGVAYTASLQAQGGTPGYTWAVPAGGLPAGLTLSASGTLSGTPTQAGTFSFTAQVTDAGSPAQTQSEALSVKIAPASLAIVTSALAQAQIGASYSVALQATGGVPEYVWKLRSGTLPAGLTLSTAGVLSGVPTVAGSYALEVHVRDNDSPVQMQKAAFTLVVAAPPLSMVTTSLNGGQVATAYQSSLQATGGTPGYTWAIQSGSSLPAGLSLSPAGLLSGTPRAAGSFAFGVTATDSSSPAQTIAASLSLVIVPPPITIVSSTLAAGQEGTAYSVPLQATGGTPQYTWKVTGGNLPDGLQLSADGVLSGTPNKAGTYSFTVKVKDSSSPAQTQTAVISMAVASADLRISHAAPANATTGVAYTAWLQATGGTPGYSWRVKSGTLPSGLSLSDSGEITGTPATAGQSSFVVQVTDSGSPAQKKTATFSVIVAPAPLTITSNSLAKAQNGTSYSTTLQASGGTPAYRWSIASGSLPAGLTLGADGGITGTPSATGTATFTVQVTDGGSPAQTQTATLSLKVAAPPLSIRSTTLQSGKKGASYKSSLQAAGGIPAYAWKLQSGSLPSGLGLSQAGVISGTPTASGTTSFAVQVSDSESPAQIQSATISLTVAPPTLAIGSPLLPNAQNGTAYSTLLAATGGTPGYTWTLVSGALPSGLSLSTTGAISGTPAVTGTFGFAVQVTDGGSPAQTQSASLTLTIAPAALSISPVSLPTAQTGTPYSAPLAATGGTPGYRWAVVTGSLPAGLKLSAGGVISGTATVAGTFHITVEVTDSGTPAQTETAGLSLTVSPAALSITSASLANAEQGASYATTLKAAGGTAPYAWALRSGSLPAGLSLSASGQIAGTPSVAGSFAFTVQVTDQGSPGQTQTAALSLIVDAPALTITSSSLPKGQTGKSYTTTLKASGGTPGYTWSILSGTLPSGLSLTGSGVLSGTPATAGTVSLVVQVTDSGSPAQTQTAKLSLSIGNPALAITSSSLANAVAGSSYMTTLQASGGVPGYTWSLPSGALPAGLTLNAAGVISGVPSAAGSFTFSVQVTDSDSQTRTASLSLTVTGAPLTISTATLGSGQSGTAYSASLAAAGGSPGYAWQLASGNLPAGLSLSGAGVISGTPTEAGNSSFTVQVTDSGTPVQTATAVETIIIGSAPVSTPPPPSAPSATSLYLYPQAPIAPRGTYQTVTAIVTGVNDKTVTWSSDGGTIVGTNPCVANEPCMVALYSTDPGAYHLTATSDADHTVVATSTVTFTASPLPRTDHPRFMATADELTALRDKATAGNPMYQGIKTIAGYYYPADSSIWKFSTWNGTECTGGSGPRSDQSANYRENDTWWITLVALFDASSETRNQYGCAARDIFMTNIGYVLSGELDLSGGNRWADGAIEWAFTADYLMGAGYLNASDLSVVRKFMAKLAYEQINDTGNGTLAVIGNYNSPAQFNEATETSSTGMRAMGNNYTHARILLLTGAALTFNDNTTDDPPLANTCGATRYQVCPDGTAGSLHAYWTYVSGGMLYKDWADMDDPAVVQQAYNSAFSNLPSTPMCNTLWHTPMPCLGIGRGGEANEGTGYGSSVEKLRWALNAIHTAGYDDPILYGPQMSMETMSYWDLRYVSDLTSLTGLSGASTEQSRWNFLSDGDTLYYYDYPSNHGVEAGLLSSDASYGRKDRAAALEWLVMNTAFGTADGQTGNCSSYCGVDGEFANDYGSTVALDLFLALPGSDPVTTNAPADPRPGLPTDWYDAGNQHLVTRSGWGTDTNTIFSYFCTNTQIDHEHQYCGGFSVYSNGEYITKGRTEFNDYNNEMSTVRNQNLPELINTPLQTGCTYANGCAFADAAELGGQLWHGYQAGLNTLYFAQLPTYVAAVADSTNDYNGGWGGFGQLNGVTAASRSLIYLRSANQVVYYDRGSTGANAWEKANFLVTTGTPTIAGNTASWLTRSGQQRVYWTQLQPSTNTPKLDLAYTDADTANDWEIFGRIKSDAGPTPSARFLSLLQWGPAAGGASSATVVESASGTPFEGALVGSSLVMFMRDWPSTFTTVTYPASGATTQYISDLAPNTTYSISGAGAPGSGTTDNAGVLTFTASGSGSVTIAAISNP